MFDTHLLVQVDHTHLDHAHRLEESRRAHWIRQVRQDRGGNWRLNPAGLLWTSAVLLAAVTLLT